MADSNVIKYISLDNMTLYTQLMKSYINSEDAKSLKTVMLSTDGRSLEFYRDSEPITAGSIPAYSIAIPETNLDSCMKKVISALSGDVAVFDANGQVFDGGIKLSDLITRADVETLIATAVEQSTHITTTVVTTLPTDQEAKANVIYLIKDDTVPSGDDSYEEYLKINGTLQKIGTTATNLSGYATQSYVNDRITAERTSIITEAVTTADSHADTKDAQILLDAQTYTDQQVQGITDSIDVVEAKTDANTTNISNLALTVQSNTDRIALLEQSEGLSLVEASENEIRTLFTEE